MVKHTLLSITAFLFLTGCSVYQASKNNGISEDDIYACTNRLCIQSLEELTVLSTDKKGERTTETYRAKRRKNNVTYGRAFLYGAAAVGTLGLSEVVTTPLEGYLSNDEFLVFQVSYDKDFAVINVVVQQG